MMKIIQIVPRLKPTIDGVGDYALVLAKALSTRCGIESVFLICDPFCQGVDYIDGFQAIQLKKRSKKFFVDFFNKLIRTHHFSKVLLQYVSYGYEKRGCPEWLVKGLEEIFRENATHIPLVTMFHELGGASLRPWNSYFWNQFHQQNLVNRLIQVSVEIATNCEFQQAVLEHKSKHLRKVRRMPVLSNIGELACLPKWQKRENSAIIFGRNQISKFEDWVKLDLQYIDNWNLLLDFRIIIKTFPAVFKGAGV